MPGIPMMKAANDGEFVHYPGALGEQVANMNTRNLGGNGTERSPVFLRGIGLGIPSFVLTGASPLPKDDDRLGLFPLARFQQGLGPKQVTISQPGQPKGARLDETPTITDQVPSEFPATESVRLAHSNSMNELPFLTG
jgi:hypothetical protein